MIALAQYMAGSRSFKLTNLKSGTGKCMIWGILFHFLRDTKLPLEGQILPKMISDYQLKGQVLPLAHFHIVEQKWIRDFTVTGRAQHLAIFFKNLQLLLEKRRRGIESVYISGVFLDQFLPGLFRKIDISLAFELSQTWGVEDHKNIGSTYVVEATTYVLMSFKRLQRLLACLAED